MTANLPPCGGDARQDRGGALSRQQIGQFWGVFPHASRTEDWHSFTPPSALPGISPTRGEISSVAVAPDITP